MTLETGASLQYWLYIYKLCLITNEFVILKIYTDDHIDAAAFVHPFFFDHVWSVPSLETVQRKTKTAKNIILICVHVHARRCMLV